MKHNLIWKLMSLVMLSAMVLSACAPAPGPWAGRKSTLAAPQRIISVGFRLTSSATPLKSRSDILRVNPSKVVNQNLRGGYPIRTVLNIPGVWAR